MRPTASSFTRCAATLSTVVFLLLSGCGHASPPTVDFAADALYLGNPINRIVLIGSSNVFWPNTEGKQAAVDVAASKQCQEQSLGLMRNALAQKGYSVGAAVPMGVAFVDPSINYSEFQYIGPDGSEVPWRAMMPVFEYPHLRGNPNLERAVRDFIEPMNLPQPGQPNSAAVKYIVQTLDPTADTLCHLHARGNKYSGGRRFGAAMLGRHSSSLQNRDFATDPLSALTGQLNDNLYSNLMCVEVASGTRLWEDLAIDPNVDPASPVQDHAAKIIQYLPPRGSPMNPEVQRSTGGPPPRVPAAPTPTGTPGK
jgi:hypothetical protein